MLGQLHIHAITRLRTRRLFKSGIPPRQRNRLFTDLDTCNHCSDYYIQHHMAESALCASEGEVTHFAIERTEAALLENIASKESQKAIPFSRLAIGGVATAILAALLFVFIPRTDSHHRAALGEGATLAPAQLVSRGDESDVDPSVGIRVFKVESEKSVREKNQVTLDDVITFTYTHTNSEPGFLVIFGIQTGGKVLRYYPDYGDSVSIEISGKVVDKPLGDGIVLKVNHEQGWLRIVSAFSKEPMNMDAIERNIAEAEVEEKTQKNLKPLSIEALKGSIQHSVLMEIN